MEIKGAKELIEWFGEWPSFHDAEIVELHLNRQGDSFLKLRTWRMTNKVNDKGYYIHEKHAVITFTLFNIKELDLSGFSGQNVISSLSLEQIAEGYKLEMHLCYGLAGILVAQNISVEFQPYKPA